MIRKEERRGKRHWILDIRYETADGHRARYRRDARVQTRAGAEAEHRRLLLELAKKGTLDRINVESKQEREKPYTFTDAVRHFRATHMQTALKPSTRVTYEHWIDVLLLPRMGTKHLSELAANDVSELDAELVQEELAPATRCKVHTVLRSVLRTAVRDGLLSNMPALPRMPKVGRKCVRPMRTADVQNILAAASASARLAFALIAFAGLRPCEVRGLRWTDVDLDVGTITVRRGITVGAETTPKSHHHRVVPIATPLSAYLKSPRHRSNRFGEVTRTELGGRWGDFGLNQAFKRAQKRAELSGWSVYDLRHYFVTELFRSGVPAPVVQKLAGHADLATTQRYADVDANDLRSAIALFGATAGKRGIEATPSPSRHSENT